MSLAGALVLRVGRGLRRRARPVTSFVKSQVRQVRDLVGDLLDGADERRVPEPPARVSPFASSPPAPVPVPDTDVVSGPMLTFAEVEALLEDMVRPALISDGGDITLVRVENNDVFVQLNGACSTCSSSVVTMRQGIERLLREEFPHFRELHEVPGHA